jgi:hypothetical protein
MHTCIVVTGYPRSGNLPAPSRHRSPALSQTVRGSPHTPAAASRWSKIGPIDRPRQHACKHRCDRIPRVRQTARAVAPSLSGTLADCARPRGRSPDTKDCAIKKCSARLLTDSQGRLPAKVEYALCANTSLLACVYTIAVGCPSFTLCQELNTDGRFERSMVEHRSHLPSPRAERCGVFDGSPAVSSNAATQGLGRKEYGAGTDPTEREWQPYTSVVRLIRMGSSGDNLESGDFSYGRRRTFIS